MRLCARDKETVYYQLYLGDTDAVDADGNYTGEKAVTYGEQSAEKMFVTTDKGYAEHRPFGDFLDYSRVMVTDNKSCPINEQSIVWVGVSKTDSHNYIVARVANDVVHGGFISYALKEVDVSA